MLRSIMPQKLGFVSFYAEFCALSNGTNTSFYGAIFRSNHPKQIYTIQDKKCFDRKERSTMPQKLIFEPFESAENSVSNGRKNRSRGIIQLAIWAKQIGMSSCIWHIKFKTSK